MDVSPLKPSDVDGSDPASLCAPLSPEERSELGPEPPCPQPISREEGYRRSRGKEGPAIELALDFFTHHGMPGDRIEGAVDNYQNGDLRFPGGTVEVKGQPIDPTHYQRNFVEVLEDTTKLHRPHHRGGFRRTAEFLQITPEQLAAAQINFSGRTLGHLAYVSASLTPIAGSFATVYVNADDGHLFLYTSEKLLSHIRMAVLGTGLVRGKGNSNDDTLAVFVPTPAARWQKRNGVWKFTGPGDERPYIATLRRKLGSGD